MDILERRLSTAEVQTLSLPLQNDLIAIFGVIGDAADRLLDKAVTEGWTPEVFIDELVRLIAGDNRAPETVATPKLEELSVNKSQLQTLKVLEKSLETLLVMKAAKPIGTVSERKDGRYRKVSDGAWEKVTEQGNGIKEESASSMTSNPQKEYNDVVSKYKGTDEWMKSPNGKPTKLNEKQWVQTRTPAFKSWFGDFENDPENASKAVDENGEPMVVYHGTNAEFNEFMKDKIGSANQYDAGFFFTTDKQVAANYGGNVISAFINARNGIKEKRKARAEEKQIPEIDHIHNAEDRGIWIVFEPNQIKSATDNEGTFDPNSNKLSKSMEARDARK